MRLITLYVCVVLFVCDVYSQAPTLGLSGRVIEFNTSTFSVQLVNESQTLYFLQALSGNASSSFIPTDQMTLRQYNGNYHLGDITFRARSVGSTTWTSGDTSVSRRPVTPLNVSGSTLAAANLSPTLPSNALLDITRRWVLSNGTLELLFDVNNPQSSAVEIGALGAPLEFNNVRNLSHL